jgi:hypothetical protein
MLSSFELTFDCVDGKPTLLQGELWNFCAILLLAAVELRIKVLDIFHRATTKQWFRHEWHLHVNFHRSSTPPNIPIGTSSPKIPALPSPADYASGAGHINAAQAKVDDSHSHDGHSIIIVLSTTLPDTCEKWIEVVTSIVDINWMK